MAALLPPSSSSERPEPGRDARCELLAHLRRAGGGDERDPRIVGELNRAIGAADDELGEPVRHAAEALGRALEQRHARERGERRPLGGLPDHGVAADEGERGVPAPDGDREVEGADHRDGPERMPRLGEAVAGTLRRDRAAVELAREADREVADVDHLLHLAEPLLRDLPDLERDERAERLLLAAQLLAEQPHELAAVRARAGRATRRMPPRRGRRRHRLRPRRFGRPAPISSPVIGVRTTRSPPRRALRATPSRSSSPAADVMVSTAMATSDPPSRAAGFTSRRYLHDGGCAQPIRDRSRGCRADRRLVSASRPSQSDPRGAAPRPQVVTGTCRRPGPCRSSRSGSASHRPRRGSCRTPRGSPPALLRFRS